MNQKLTYMHLLSLAIILLSTVLSRTAYCERQYRDEYQSREILQMPDASKAAPVVSGVRLKLKPGFKEEHRANEQLNFPRTKASDSNKLGEEEEENSVRSSKAKARALLSLITLSALRSSNQP